MTLDTRITYAFILAVVVETSAGLIWAGQAAERLSQVERAAAVQPEVLQRLVRLEEQLSEARNALVRIERLTERGVRR